MCGESGLESQSLWRRVPYRLIALWRFFNEINEPESQGIWRLSFLVFCHNRSDLILDVSNSDMLNWIQTTCDFGAQVPWYTKAGSWPCSFARKICGLGLSASVNPASIPADDLCRILAWFLSGQTVCCQASLRDGVCFPGVNQTGFFDALHASRYNFDIFSLLSRRSRRKTCQT
jgi:hypothetical protein